MELPWSQYLELSEGVYVDLGRVLCITPYHLTTVKNMIQQAREDDPLRIIDLSGRNKKESALFLDTGEMFIVNKTGKELLNQINEKSKPTLQKT
jgi:hypothetical protein